MAVIHESITLGRKAQDLWSWLDLLYRCSYTVVSSGRNGDLLDCDEVDWLTDANECCCEHMKTDMDHTAKLQGLNAAQTGRLSMKSCP